MLIVMSPWARATAAAILALVVGASAHGQAVSYYEEQGQLIRSQRNVATLGTGLFGDKVNLYTGGLEFVQTDVTIPGNSALPVSIARRLSTGATRLAGGHFGDWELEIPRLQGVFGKTDGWKVNPVSLPAGVSPDPNKRCSQFAEPPVGYSQSGTWQFLPEQFWSGSHLYVPGAGTQEMLIRGAANTLQPLDGQAYPLVTSGGWQIRCLTSLAPGNNQAGEGFLAVAPDGTQYRFDWMVSRDYMAIKASGSGRGANSASRMSAGTSITSQDIRVSPTGANGEIMFRKEVWILPTQITDRYGHTVTYTYDPANPWQLKTILANDGRRLELDYASGTNLVQSVRMESTADGTRTWTYNYLTNGTASLSSVTLPDSTQWTFSGSTLQANISYVSPPSYCADPGVLATDSLTKTMTHPSGAVGSFTVTGTLHALSFVDACNVPEAPPVVYFGVRSLTNKTLSGPGLTPQTWTYNYSAASGGVVPCTGCTGTKQVTVTDPRNVQARHTFGTRSKIDEGLLLSVEVGPAGSPVRTTSYRYRSPAVGPYPDPIGVSPVLNARGDGYISTRHNPQDQRVITQQGVSFTWEATNFDKQGRATSVSKSGPGGSRTEATTYEDNVSKWVMGQVKKQSVTADGITKTEVENIYNPATGVLESTSQYGRPATHFGYHLEGTDAAGKLATRTDGRQYTTSFDSYKRGIPRLVSYPNATHESAEVNDFGLVTSVTGAASNTTEFGYDAAGRLNLITPPTGWTATSLTLTPVQYAEYGLATGHWKQTVTQGNAVTETYFDALWRPAMTRTYDANQPSTTRKVVVRQFDADGHTTYESYPQRDIASVSATPGGVTTNYDALGRVTSVLRNTETGTKTTTTDYLSGFQTRLTNALSKVTTQSFWALNDPDSAQLASIAAPEGVNVAITRDFLGKPLSIRRWGSARGVSADVTRSYVYDTTERLCKTLEPEVIATVQAYDDAGNVQWRAPGVNLPTGACDRNNVTATKKITYGYDELNQLTTVGYGDGSPSITRTYKPDGLLATIASNGSLWTYEYNSLRKLASETFSYGGKTFDFGWGYNTNGNLSALTYPTGGPVVLYAPNALGESTQVSSYATGVSYHPNGAVSGFTFGNGIVHSLTQTLEGTPKLNADGTVLKDLYTYDANGNVLGIEDQRAGPSDGSSSRTMTYDDLDRLAGVSAPGIWGNASYVYDPVDNLRTAIVGTRGNTLSYADGTNRLTALSTSTSGGAPTTAAYGYDSNGNISSKGQQTFTFDLGNRLQAASLGGSYAYDGHGRRFQVVSTDGSTRLQLYSQGGQLLWGEKSSTGNIPATLNYTCSTGVLVGNQCITTTTYDASITYGCNPGDTRSGGTCYTSNSYTATTTWSCPNGGTVSGSTCTVDAVNYSATISYSCPSGGSLSGSTCTIASYNYGATASYSCPSNASLSGSTCTVASYNYGATASYSCANGGTLSGSSCNRIDDYSATATYSCPNGGTLSGTTCTRTNSVGATVTYSCPSDYSLSGSTCTKITTAAATSTVTCNGYGTLWPDGVTCMTYNLAVTYTSDDGWNACSAAATARGLLLLDVESVTAKARKCYFGAVAGPYTCPNGGTLNGTQCVSTATQSATAAYSCSSGTLSGSQCLWTDTYGASASYSCPNGGTVDGAMCRKTTTYGATADYSCPSGGSLSGSTCTVAAVSYGATASYSCPSGGTLSGSTCTVAAVSYGATASYSCASGGTLSGSTCTLPAGSYGATASYSCPNGGALTGTTCTTTNSYAASQSYACNNGDAANGSSCSHQTATQAASNYSCAVGNVLPGNLCAGATNSTKTAYIYLGNRQIAEAVVGGATQYVHTDALGSPVAHTNASGVKTDATKYEPYGYTAMGTKPGPNTSVIGFTGHVNDPETDLVYMQQRYYDPIAGRFLSVDPVVTDANTGKDFGLYTYVDNNPYTKVDPDGRRGVVGAIYGAIAGGTGGYVSSGGSFREKAVGVVTGAVAGGVVGLVAPQTSRFVGMAAAGMAASSLGQASGSAANAAIDKGVTNVSQSDVKVDGVTTVLGGIGAGVGGLVGKGISQSTMGPIIGQTLEKAGAPTTAGLVAGTLTEGAITGGAEKMAGKVTNAVNEATEKVKDLVSQ